MATNLVAEDTGGQQDIFVHDRVTNTNVLASISSNGDPANGGSLWPSISGNGRYVAFGSVATNLVSGDTNGKNDVFVHDLVTGSTKRVSVSSSGQQGDNDSTEVSISNGGSVVAFMSTATDLVPGDTNGGSDIFVHDLASGDTKRVSVTSTGAEGPGGFEGPAISGDGTIVAFSGGALMPSAGQFTNVYRANISTGAITLVSHAVDGSAADDSSREPVLSSNGRFVAFASNASNLTSTKSPACWPAGYEPMYCDQVYEWDSTTDKITAVSVSDRGAFGTKDSEEPSITPDGSKIAFTSASSNLVSHDTNGVLDDFVRDVTARTTRLVSVSGSGVQGNANSQEPSIDSNGGVIAFESYASNLVTDDKNAEDVFVRLA